MQNEETARLMVTREATLGDAEAVHVLSCELARAVGDSRPGFAAVRGRLRELLEEPRARVVVAESGGEVVGVASVWIKPDLGHGDTAVEVPMLAVRKDYRRQGVGRRLMEEVRSIAAGYEANVIELVATGSNAAAREFYRSLGFVETDHVALEFVGEMGVSEPRQG